MAQMENKMGKINWTRVLLGGLVAGVIINISEFVTNGVFLAPYWAEAFEGTRRSMVPNAGIIFLIWGFLMGIGAIWLYAAARPRFGPGIKTAVISGFAFWVFTAGLVSIDEATVGLYPFRLVTTLALVCLVQDILASVAGAWLYKEYS